MHFGVKKVITLLISTQYRRMFLLVAGGWTTRLNKYARQVGSFPQGSGCKKNETTTYIDKSCAPSRSLYMEICNHYKWSIIHVFFPKGLVINLPRLSGLTLT